MSRPKTIVSAEPNLPSVDAGALRLLACVAMAILLVCLLLLASGPGEHVEGLSWTLAFAVALPAGMGIAAIQERRLAAAAPAAAARGIAAGAAALALALVGRRFGSDDGLWHAVVPLAALLALVAPLLSALLWRRAEDGDAILARALAVVATGEALTIFLPSGSRAPSELLIAVPLAAAAVALLHWRRPPLSPRWRTVLDGGIVLGLVLVVVQLPQLQPFSGDTLLHHGFFLGPVNDVLHGRAMLAGAWSQYGVGMIDALGLVFTVVPIGFGSFGLIIVAITVAQYLCVLATLRLAGVGQLLTVLALAVAVLGNTVSTLDYYLVFPSASALRFGFPYLIVLIAVLAARQPARRRIGELAMLAVLGLASVWSFEMLAYTAGTYGSLALVEALSEGSWRRLGVALARGLVVCTASVLVFSLLTLALAGKLDWGPYVEYIRQYSSEGLAQLPVVVFSAGPLMGLAIFASAVTLLWLVQARGGLLTPPPRAAIAGFTGFAIVTFTYYVGRSHPNNLLILLVPTVALGALWGQVLLDRGRGYAALLAGATLAFAGAMIAVAAGPSLEAKARETAIGLAVPGGRSPQDAFHELANNPPLEPSAPIGVELLDRHLAPEEPALVLAGPRISAEILLRSNRSNLLPISDAEEDVLIDSSFDRVRAASWEIPAGTLLLRSAFMEGLEQAALTTLVRRFSLIPIETSADGALELDRLVPWRWAGQ